MYRSELISDDEVLQQAIVGSTTVSSNPKLRDSFSSMGSMHLHPEFHYVVKKSQYRGVKFDESTGSWVVEGTTRMFQTEKEAATNAYYQTVRMSDNIEEKPTGNIVTPPPGFTSNVVRDREDLRANKPNVETPEEATERRKGQLVAFYNYWDPSKTDVQTHVSTLFDRHDFRFIARAVKQKYGLVPPGWDDEISI
jgi:hypothetical protein